LAWGTHAYRPISGKKHAFLLEKEMNADGQRMYVCWRVFCGEDEIETYAISMLTNAAKIMGLAMNLPEP
jgi:hypothetical protein